MKALYCIMVFALFASCSLENEVHQANKGTRIVERWLKSTDTACGKSIKAEWKKKLPPSPSGEKTYRSFSIKTTRSNTVYITAETPSWYIPLVVNIKTREVTCDSLPERKKSRL